MEHLGHILLMKLVIFRFYESISHWLHGSDGTARTAVHFADAKPLKKWRNSVAMSALASKWHTLVDLLRISKPTAFDPNSNSDVVIAASMVTPLEKDWTLCHETLDSACMIGLSHWARTRCLPVDAEASASPAPKDTRSQFEVHFFQVRDPTIIQVGCTHVTCIHI
jgi:hypothetical protein